PVSDSRCVRSRGGDAEPHGRNRNPRRARGSRAGPSARPPAAMGRMRLSARLGLTPASEPPIDFGVMSAYPLLSTIGRLADYKSLDEADLPQLADEIREFLIDAVAKTGGHIGPNLGVVELTMAIHRVFDSPHDQIVF